MGKKIFIKEDIQMANKYKKMPTLYNTKNLQIKIVRYHCTPIRMVKIRNSNNTKCWWEYGATVILIYCWRKFFKNIQPFWKTVWQSTRKLITVSAYGPAIVSQAFNKLVENFVHTKTCTQGFPGGAVVENLPANAGDTGSSPGLGRSHMPRSN